MDVKEVVGTFEETAQYQRKYESLLAVCDAEGTIVLQDRLLERDQDIAPYRFFRKGTREYVFPQQETSLAEDKSHVIDPSSGYGLRTEEQTFNFNQDLVEGKIRIEYDDSGNRPLLKVSDVNRDSKIPEAVRKTLEDIF